MLYRRLHGMNDVSKWLVFISVKTTKKQQIFIFQLPRTKCQVLSYCQETNQSVCRTLSDKQTTIANSRKCLTVKQNSPVFHHLRLVIFIVSCYLFAKLLHELFHKRLFLLKHATKNFNLQQTDGLKRQTIDWYASAG